MFAAVAVFGLAACQTMTLWTKDGWTQELFNKDAYECERDARQSGYFGGGLIGALAMQEFQERCLVARGWRKLPTA